MSDRPAPVELVVLDVNETLSDLSPLADRFRELGLPGELASVWFAALLRDGFALTAAGTMHPFADLGRAGLRTLFATHLPDRGVDDAVEHVLGGFTALEVHPDVGPGLARLGELGLRVVTLSNGSAGVAEGLLERAGLRGRVEAVLSVEDVGIWKPAGAAYRHALDKTGVRAERAMLVAVHPWDTDGARRAGLQAGWIQRGAGAYPEHFLPPTVQAESLVGLADRLADLRA